jgi:hypothetical protein
MKLVTLRCLTTAIAFGVLSMPGRLVAQASSGTITFDAPGAAAQAGSGFGTFPGSLNDAGAITGH